MKLNTEKKLILSFLAIGCITYFLEYYEDIKEFTNDVMDRKEYNYPSIQNEQTIDLQSPSYIQEQVKVSKFRNPNDVMSYVFSNTFSGNGITLRISMGGISGNGTGIGYCPEVIHFDDYKATLRYKSFTGQITTLYVNSIDGTLTTGSGERFYAQ